MPTMHQYTFGGRAPPGPAGELMCSPYSLATIRGPSSKGKERKGLWHGKGWGGEEGGEVEGGRTGRG